MKLFELNYSQIQHKQQSITKLFPSFIDRKKKVKENGGATLVSQEKGIFEFLVSSGTVKGKHYAVRCLFENVPETIAEAASDPNMWGSQKQHLNLMKVGSYVIYNADLKLSSDAPVDQFWGSNYQRTKVDAELDNIENRPPDVRNPNQYGIMGKHANIVMDKLPLLVSTMADHLKKYFSSDIRAIESEYISKLYKPSYHST